MFDLSEFIITDESFFVRLMREVSDFLHDNTNSFLENPELF